MNNKSYKLLIGLLCVFSLLVSSAGLVLSRPVPYPEAQHSEDTPVVNPLNNQTAGNKNLLPIVSTDTAESYDTLLGTITLLKNRYPELIKTDVAGYSEGGRALFMYTLGNGEKKALIIGGIHAREHTTTKYLLKTTEDYCKAYESPSGYLGEYDIYNLLNEYTLYILPCANPDGLEIMLSNDTPEKYVRISALSEYKANKKGVDLNRNFPIAWNQINNGVNSPADYFFKGYKSGSASETQALMRLCFENDFNFMISMHIKGNCIFWGDTHNTQNNELYKAFAEDICNATDLKMTSPTKDPKSYGGGFENWFRHQFNRPGICIELSETTNTILPCGDENYKSFDEFVIYEKTKNAIAAAMTSSYK